MACDESVYAAGVLISLEFLYRWRNYDDSNDFHISDATFSDFKNHIYIIFYLISISSTILYVKGTKDVSFPKFIEPFVPLLYLFDSAGAIGLGLSLFYENRNGLLTSMVVLTNFFLLHILHTLFSKKGGSLVSA
jgi:hypothetical protein